MSKNTEDEFGTEQGRPEPRETTRDMMVDAGMYGASLFVAVAALGLLREYASGDVVSIGSGVVFVAWITFWLLWRVRR